MFISIIFLILINIYYIILFYMNHDFNNDISYINSKTSAEIDYILMNEYNFSSEQLMEIAGQSAALIIYDSHIEDNDLIKDITIVSGPGNNGGDGLVIGRYLKIFKPSLNIKILYPKASSSKINKDHLETCRINKVTILEKEFFEKNEIDKIINDNIINADLIVDAIFGYSFISDSISLIKPPFKSIIDSFIYTKAKIVSIDVPSGWEVDKEFDYTTNSSSIFVPNTLISIGLPKICSFGFMNSHYLGGRFIPDILFNRLNLRIPIYKGKSLYLKLK